MRKSKQQDRRQSGKSRLKQMDTTQWPTIPQGWDYGILINWKNLAFRIITQLTGGTGMGMDVDHYKNILIAPMAYGQSLTILALVEALIYLA